MLAVSNGAELVKRILETKTPSHKLEPARDCLRTVYENEGRIATSSEILQALEAAYPGSELLTKARSIMERGEWAPPQGESRLRIEDQLLGKPPLETPPLIVSGATDPSEPAQPLTSAGDETAERRDEGQEYDYAADKAKTSTSRKKS